MRRQGFLDGVTTQHESVDKITVESSRTSAQTAERASVIDLSFSRCEPRERLGWSRCANSLEEMPTASRIARIQPFAEWQFDGSERLHHSVNLLDT